MANQHLIKRICAKSKELAIEKKKNHNLSIKNQKLTSKMLNFKVENENLNSQIQELKKKVKLMEITQKKAIYEILFLKQELHEEKKLKQQYETPDSEPNYVDILNSQDSYSMITYSDEIPNTDDEDMIDSAYNDSKCDEDVEYEPSTKESESESEEESATSNISTDQDEIMN